MRKPGENRGGPRPGSGPKPGNNTRQYFSNKERREIVAAARRLKKETGKSVGDYLMELISGKDKAFRAQGIRIYLDSVISKESQQDITVQHQQTGPGIYLPEEKPDPATQDGVAPTSRTADRILQ